MSRENHIYEPDWSGRTDQLCSVNKPVIKKDALALVTGKPVYVDDLAPKDCLIVKVLRSPHANAIVKSVKKTDRNWRSAGLLIPAVRSFRFLQSLHRQP